VIVKRTDQDEHQAEENSFVWTGRTPRHPDHREQQQAQAAEEASDKHGGDESHQRPCQVSVSRDSQDCGQCGEEDSSEDSSEEISPDDQQLQPALQQECQLQFKRRGREETGEIPDSQVRSPPDGSHQEETQSGDVDF